MIPAGLCTLETLDAKLDNEDGAEEESERVDELVDHGVRAVGVRRPDVTFHE
jgi:hypothetical protein